MRLSVRTILTGTIAALVGSTLLMAPNAQAAPVRSAAAASAVTAPVTGTFTDADGGEGIFSGTFTPTKFTSTSTDVLATGTLTGTLTDAAGTELGTVDKSVSVPVDREASGAGTSDTSSRALAAAACQILDLRLQPLDLDLLGLVVHLDTVHLNLTAVPGAGALLGNLLCAVTGLLDGAGALAQISALLNQILAILNGLG